MLHATPDPLIPYNNDADFHAETLKLITSRIENGNLKQGYGRTCFMGTLLGEFDRDHNARLFEEKYKYPGWTAAVAEMIYEKLSPAESEVFALNFVMFTSYAEPLNSLGDRMVYWAILNGLKNVGDKRGPAWTHLRSAYNLYGRRLRGETVNPPEWQTLLNSIPTSFRLAETDADALENWLMHTAYLCAAIPIGFRDYTVANLVSQLIDGGDIPTTTLADGFLDLIKTQPLANKFARQN